MPKVQFANRIACLFVSVSILLGSVAVGDDAESSSLKIGAPMPEFELKDYRGKPWTAAEFKSRKAVAVVFVGVECPLVKLYASRLNKLKEKFADHLEVIAINSNRHDSITEMTEFVKLTGITIPLLKDPANRVADSFGATRTPEVFLFDANHRLCYSGAIDDQYTYGLQKAKSKHDFLSDAIGSVLEGENVKVDRTEPVGCIIGRILKEQPASEVTYANQISRILNDRCVSCHRPGQVAPFVLTDYEEVVGWAEMIREVVDDRRMPPWHANPEHGKFKNDPSLSEEQRKLIGRWVENGAPLGDLKDLPEPKFFEAWQIGKPDVVVAMRKHPYRVPATGVIPYKYFVVDPGFKEDKWIQAAEIRIGNRAVVHHVIVLMEDQKSRAAHGQIPSAWLTATAPGSPPLILPEGFAKLVPAGSKLVFQMHYTPNGTAQTDISSVGFKFADPEKVRKSVSTTEVLNTEFEIPPDAENHPVRATYRFRKDALVLTLSPHMHLRGKSFRYTAKYPNGDSEILLDVPSYDFNWQNGYVFPKPKKIPAGTVLNCVAHFDNSKSNFANPDPTKTVGWGDQTSDEMMIGYFDMALADQDLTKSKDGSQ